MPFIPTEKQVDSLANLLKQFIREKIGVRLIRFERWSEPNIKDCIIEVCCLEDEDRYFIFYDGIIDQKK